MICWEVWLETFQGGYRISTLNIIHSLWNGLVHNKGKLSAHAFCRCDILKTVHVSTWFDIYSSLDYSREIVKTTLSMSSIYEGHFWGNFGLFLLLFYVWTLHRQSANFGFVLHLCQTNWCHFLLLFMKITYKIYYLHWKLTFLSNLRHSNQVGNFGWFMMFFRPLTAETY